MDGITIDLEISVSQIRFNKSKAILIIGRDITERKRIENLRKDTEKIFRHDLKTPVIGMINVTNSLLTKLKNDENYEYLYLINQGARQMRSMIDYSFDLILTVDDLRPSALALMIRSPGSLPACRINSCFPRLTSFELELFGV